MERTELLEVALEAARRAAHVHREHLGRVAVEDWTEKGAADFVTEVDREAEAVVVEHILARFPDHEVMAEESTALGDAVSIRARFDAAEHLWIVDPLDGTTNFVHGYPAFASSVAVSHGGKLVAGAVVDGSSGTEWTAVAGGGAWRDGRHIAVSTIDRLDRALVGTGFPFKVLDLLPAYLRQLEAVLRRTSGVRRAGAAALDLCHVADGRLDGFWELWLAPWDIAAGTLILEEAGGVVTSLTGDRDVRAGGAILAGNATVHRYLSALLGEIEPVGAVENPHPPTV